MSVFYIVLFGGIIFWGLITAAQIWLESGTSGGAKNPIPMQKTGQFTNIMGTLGHTNPKLDDAIQGTKEINARMYNGRKKLSSDDLDAAKQLAKKLIKSKVTLTDREFEICSYFLNQKPCQKS